MNRDPNAHEYWFPAKRYGWGWSLPCRWQGWVVLLIYFALVFGGMWTIVPRWGESSYIVYLIIISGILTAVCWWKGEPPRWRWGGK